MVKAKIKSLLLKLLLWLTKTSAGRSLHTNLLQQAMLVKKDVTHNGIKLSFTAPNALNEYRVERFSQREPKTLDWIDSFDEGSTFWDIGANVGVFSCYAASKRNCEVIAFEPSVFNLELLARNIFYNSLLEKIKIMPLAISDRKNSNRLNLTTTEWGGALSTFGETYGQDGKELDIRFSFNTFGIPLDMALDAFDLRPPKYIKIDVDGIEHLILKGAPVVLDGAHQILIELNDDFLEQAEMAYFALQKAGFSLLEKTSWDCLKGTNCENSSNQIWSK